MAVSPYTTYYRDTCFKVRLPITLKDLPEAVHLYKEPALPQKVEESPVTPTEVINGKTIPLTSHEEVVLLVEDNQDLQNFITEILTVRYNVITPNDGLQGERKAFEHIPDLVISSVMMPKKKDTSSVAH